MKPGIKRELLVLKDAKALITAGWTKGEYRINVSDVMCYCAIGAVLASTNNKESASQSIHKLWRELPERFISGYTFKSANVYTFNDALGTTKSDVLDLFDRAIAKLEAELEAENEVSNLSIF